MVWFTSEMLPGCQMSGTYIVPLILILFRVKTNNKSTVPCGAPSLMITWSGPQIFSPNLWFVYQAVRLLLPPVSTGVSCWVIQAKLWKMHWKNLAMWFSWFCPLCPLILSRNDLAILSWLIQVIDFVSYFFTVLHEEKGMCFGWIATAWYWIKFWTLTIIVFGYFQHIFTKPKHKVVNNLNTNVSCDLNVTFKGEVKYLCASKVCGSGSK